MKRVFFLLLVGCGTERAPPTPCPPSGQPMPGGAVACTPNGRVCEIDWAYARDAVPLCNGMTTCVDGTWRDQANGHGCVECPSAPDAGSCSGTTFLGAICSYGSIVCGCTFCDGNGWTCKSMPAPCGPRPELGKPCSDPTARCDYGTTIEICTGGIWTMQSAKCP